MYSTIVPTTTLFEHLNNPNWVIFDCRFDVTQSQWGREVYQEAHIPGAHYCDLDQDLSSPIRADSGRHPLPDAQILGRKLAQWGVSSDTQVVVYDEAIGAVAARMWWTLGWLGHRAVALLDGGLEKWCQDGHPLTNQIPQAVSPGNFQPHPNDNKWVSTADIEHALNDQQTVLIDARSAARFSGSAETVDPVGGHIPGAVSQPLTDNIGDSGCFLSPEQLRQRYQSLCRDNIVHYCGSGVTACHNLLAMEIAGLKDSRLYIGSWSEWIRSKDRPIATGSK